MAHSGISLGKRLRYAFDNFMSRRGFSVFLALVALFAVLVLVMSLLRLVVNIFWPDEAYSDFFTMMWIQFLQVSDGGAVAEDTGSNALNRVVGIVTMLGGMVVFSSLVAFISSQFESKMEELRKGKSDVIESGHSLILGFGDRVPEIIKELVVANESEHRPAIVVLADTPKNEMDDYFRDRVPNTQNTRLITREGSPSSMTYLERVGVSQAKSVMILNSVGPSASEADRDLADARVLKTILAVLSCTGESNAPPIVAELHSKEKQRLAKGILPGTISIIDGQSVLGKLMVQTSRVSGLAKVYDNLVGFDGSEFYLHRPESGWNGLSYGKVGFHYPECSVVGLHLADGLIHINPPADTILDEHCEVVLLAEDDSTIRFVSSGVSYPHPLGTPRPAQVRSTERQLLAGWSHKAYLIVEEYLTYMVDGSALDILLEEENNKVEKELSTLRTKHPGITFALWTGGFERAIAQGLQPESYDNILILTGDDGEAELRDSQTIAYLLEFRSYFRGLPAASNTQIITEVADSENIQIVEDAGVKDFLISDRFVSKIYAQVSENPLVLEVYQQLFSADGSETYLKPLSLYGLTAKRELSYADLCAMALARGETCLGLRLLADENHKEANYGIIINPPKAKTFTLGPDDCLITLAEDES